MSDKRVKISGGYRDLLVGAFCLLVIAFLTTVIFAGWTPALEIDGIALCVASCGVMLAGWADLSFRRGQQSMIRKDG